MSDQIENVLILGSGPAGLTAAIYAARAGLNPLVLEGPQPGGQLTITTEVENFPGFAEGVQGPDLIQVMKDQAERFGTRIEQEWITSVDLSGQPLIVKGSDSEYRTRTLIVATGATAKMLGVEGEAEMMGRGLSACATCDGFFYRDKEVLVVGGGDSAVEEAIYLTRFGKRVRLIHRRDALRASKIMQDRALAHPKIEILWNRDINRYLGDPMTSGLTGVELRDTVSGALSEVKADGVFIAIGHKPNTDLFEGLLAMDPSGYLELQNGTSETAIPGVFAAGDVHDSRYRQAITAAGAGCRAALDAERWLEELDS